MDQPIVAPTPAAPVEVPKVSVTGGPEAAAANAPATEDKKPEQVSSKFAALAKREKAIQQKAEAFKATQAQVEAEKARIAKYDQLAAEAKKNPMGLLKELGWTYQDLTNFVLNEEKPTADLEVKQVRNELEEYKKQQEDAAKKQQEEAKAKQEEQTTRMVTQFKTEILDHVKAAPDDYEFTLREEPQEIADLIYGTIEQHYEKTNKIMSKKEAADLVENWLVERVTGYTETKKFKSKFGEKSAEQKAPPQPSKTLANGLTPSSLSPTAPARNQEERIARALAKLTQK